MKLKDIVPYCLNAKNGIFEKKYYWIVNGLTYTIDSLETKGSDFTDGLFNYELHYFDSVNYIHLSRYNFVNPNETQREYDPKDNYLVLSLDNEITIFDKFIMIHKTRGQTTDSESKLFFKTHYNVANGHDYSSECYTLGLYSTDALGGMANNLRTVFKDLIVPPVTPKPVELTLDEKVDDLIDELMKENKVKAIKKLKRMLNERL